MNKLLKVERLDLSELEQVKGGDTGVTIKGCFFGNGKCTDKGCSSDKGNCTDGDGEGEDDPKKPGIDVPGDSIVVVNPHPTNPILPSLP